MRDRERCGSNNENTKCCSDASQSLKPPLYCCLSHAVVIVELCCWSQAQAYTRPHTPPLPFENVPFLLKVNIYNVKRCFSSPNFFQFCFFLFSLFYIKFHLLFCLCSFINILESERIRKTIRFETVQYGDTFTNETFDIYGIDLPKGIDFVHVFLFI